MIRVSIDLLPGGDPRRLQKLATLDIVNISDLAPRSDYRLALDGTQIAIVDDHPRDRGFWPLVRRAVQLAAFYAPRRG